MTVPYYLKVVERDGTNHATRIVGETAASSLRPVWELDGPGHLDFDLETVDSDAALMIPTQREVQLWYDDGVAAKCKWWGPVWRRDAQGAKTTVQCRGLLSYLERIQLGPVLTEYLLDPDFEDATLTHWTATGATKSSETTIVRKGTRSMKLVSAAVGLDQYASQQFTFDNSLGTEAVAFFVRARFYFVNTVATPEIGPAYLERGLYAKRIEGGVDQTEPNGQVGVFTTITNSLPRNQWVRIFAPPISIPAGHIQTVEVRCYSPGGTIYWDTSTAKTEESTGANTPTTYADVNTILANTLVAAQDTTADHTNFHLVGPSGTFGTTLQRQQQFYSHGMCWAAMVKPLVDAGVLDIDVIWSETAPTTRTMTTYTSRGSASGLTFTLGSGSDLVSYSQDGLTTAGRITMLPQGMSSEVTVGTVQPAADDVAYASDTSANGGVVLDEVISAVPEATLDQLASQVTTELARRKPLVSAPVFLTAADAWWASGVGLGDTVTIAGSYGWVGGANAPLGLRRVMSLALFAEKNLMAVTVI